jgi:hypothetical protein
LCVISPSPLWVDALRAKFNSNIGAAGRTPWIRIGSIKLGRT